MPKCNGDCFNCPYDDCILHDGDIDTDDTKELDKELDLLNLVDSDKKEKQMEYYQQNRDWLLAYYKQYYRENKEKYLEYAKRYRQRNKERISQIYKNYCQRNKERIKARHKRYYQNNRKYFAVYAKQRYRKKKKANYKAWMVKYQEFLKNRRCNINVGKDEFE